MAALALIALIGFVTIWPIMWLAMDAAERSLRNSRLKREEEKRGI